MKRKLQILIAAFFCSVSLIHSQIPNNGFESWSNTSNYSEPSGWTSMNSMSTGTFYSCTKVTDHFPASVGSFALRLENNTSLTQMTGGWGLITTGPMNYPIKPAFVITGHPTSLKGYYKYTSLNNDSMWINVILFKNGSNVMSESFRSSVTQTNWTPFTINFSNYVDADSAFIIMGAFYPSGPTSSGPKGNSVLYVDNINFDDFITNVAELNKMIELTEVYPNPANSELNIKLPTKNIQNCNLKMYNMLGSLVYHQDYENANSQIVKMDVSKLFKGFYILEIELNGTVTHKRIQIID